MACSTSTPLAARAVGLPALTCRSASTASASSSSSSSTPRCTPLRLSSSFVNASHGAPASSSALLLLLHSRARNQARVTCFARDWLRTDLSVIGFGLIGWIAPSSIPAINGESLTSLFFNSIGPELAHWPTGPAVTSPFWLWMITWHLGLFVALTLGQIGFKGRNDGYF